VRALVRQGAAVIILSPYADELEREQLLHAGACRYLLKNINTPELISEIEDVSAIHRQNGQH
jgi:CheY-like chemotaxis protein